MCVRARVCVRACVGVCVCVKFVEIFMPNKILALKNKNIKNKCGSDMWHKKPYFIYIYIYTID